MLKRRCCLNNAPTKLMRGDYVAVYIYQFPLFISDKNKHEVSDQTYNCPHNSNYQIRSDESNGAIHMTLSKIQIIMK